MKSALALLVFIGCAAGDSNRAYVQRTIAAQTRSTAVLAADAPPARWRLGQWALYRGVGPHVHFIRRVSVVALDSCGLWIVDEHIDEDYRQKLVLCFGDVDPRHGPLRLNVVIDETNGKTDVTDLRKSPELRTSFLYSKIADDVTPPVWSRFDGLAREDVDVAAGKFVQAIPSTETTGDNSAKVWRHPAAPFDGRVRATNPDGYVYELVEFGIDETAPSVVQKLAVAHDGDATAATGPNQIFALGLTSSWFSGDAGTAAALPGTHGRVGLAWQRFAILFDVHLIKNYRPATTVAGPASEFVNTVSARWVPWGRRRPVSGSRIAGASGLYLQAGVGYVQIGRNGHDVSTGLGFGGAIGWLPLHGRDWDFGFELDDHLTWLGAGEGVRNQVAVLMNVQITMPPFFN